MCSWNENTGEKRCFYSSAMEQKPQCSLPTDLNWGTVYTVDF